MDEIQAFYDAVFPQAEEAVAYIDKFDYANRCLRTSRIYATCSTR